MPQIHDYLRVLTAADVFAKMVARKLYEIIIAPRAQVQITDGWFEIQILPKPRAPVNENELTYALDAYDVETQYPDNDIRCLVSDVKIALSSSVIAKKAQQQFLLDYNRSRETFIDGKKSNEKPSDIKTLLTLSLWAKAITANSKNSSIQFLNAISSLSQGLGNQTLAVLCKHLESFELAGKPAIGFLPLQRATNYQEQFHKENMKFSKVYVLPLLVLTADRNLDIAGQNPDLEVRVKLTIDFSAEKNDPNRIRYDLCIKKINTELNFDLSALDEFRIDKRFEITSAPDTNEWSFISPEVPKLKS